MCARPPSTLINCYNHKVYLVVVVYIFVSTCLVVIAKQMYNVYSSMSMTIDCKLVDGLQAQNSCHSPLIRALVEMVQQHALTLQKLVKKVIQTNLICGTLNQRQSLYMHFKWCTQAHLYYSAIVWILQGQCKQP